YACGSLRRATDSRRLGPKPIPDAHAMLTARDDIRSRPAVRTDAPPEGWLGVWTRGTTSWFRVWAPRAHRVEVAIDARADAHVMTRDADGYWTARIED